MKAVNSVLILDPSIEFFYQDIERVVQKCFFGAIIAKSDHVPSTASTARFASSASASVSDH
jgi:hypothetical protein